MTKSFTVFFPIKTYREIMAKDQKEALEKGFDKLMAWLDLKNITLDWNIVNAAIVVGDEGITFFWKKREVSPEEFCRQFPRESFHEIFAKKIIKELFYRNPSTKCWKDFWEYINLY